MSTVLAQAQIILTADTARFTQEITNARNLSIDSFDDIKKSAQEIAKISLVGVVAGATAGATAIAAMTTEQVKLANELAKTALIANTSVTAIQKYTFAAKAAGIEQDKLGDIFKDVQDKVGDFLSTGGGELQDFFKNVAPQAHLTSDALRRLSGPEALQAMYNAMEKAKLSQSEMIFYMEGIADEASSLIPLLRDGGAGFKLWAQAAENAGAVMDEKTIRASKELKASTDLLKLSYEGVKNQLTQALIPVLSDLAVKLTNDVTLKDNARKAGDSLATGLKGLALAGLSVVATFDLVGSSLGGFLGMVGQLGNNVDWNSPYAMFQVGKNFWANNQEAAKVGMVALDDIKTKLAQYKSLAEQIQKLGTTGPNTTINSYVKLNDAIDKNNAKLGKTGKQIQDEEKDREKAAKATEKQANALQKLGDRQLAVYSAWKKQGIPDQWAKILTAEVGRENDYNVKNLFGFHKDAANGQINIGMLSWQKERGKQLASYLASQGLLVNGKIVQSQASLDAMAKFAINEIMTNPAYARTKNALLNNPNIDTNTGFAITGDNFIKWDRSGHAKLGAGAARHAAKRDAYYRQISVRSGLADGSNSFKDSQQDLQEAERLAKEQKDLQLKYINEFANEKTKLWLEHTNKETEIGKINDAKFRELALKSENTRYQNKVDLLDLEYDKQTQKANEWQQTEEERIKNNAELERRETRLTVGLHKDLVTARINEVNAKEQAALQKASDDFKAELDSINSYKTPAVDKIRADYQAKILANDRRTDISPEKIATLREAMTGQMNNEIHIARKNVADPYNSMMAEFNGTSELLNLQNLQNQRLEIIKKAKAEEVITTEQAEAAKAKVERQYNIARYDMQMSQGQQILGSVTSSLKATLGEHNRAYRVMFAVEKGVNIARSLMAINTGIAMAAANPFPMNLGAMVSVASATASIVSDLMAIKNPVGQAHDGIMSVPESGTWNLQKGERVLPEHTASRLDRTLDDINGNRKNYGNAQVNVVFENHTSATISQAPSKDGEMRFIIRDEIDSYVPQQLSQTNSPISKALLQNTTATRRV